MDSKRDSKKETGSSAKEIVKKLKEKKERADSPTVSDAQMKAFLGVNPDNKYANWLLALDKEPEIKDMLTKMLVKEHNLLYLNFLEAYNSFQHTKDPDKFKKICNIFILDSMSENQLNLTAPYRAIASKIISTLDGNHMSQYLNVVLNETGKQVKENYGDKLKEAASADLDNILGGIRKLISEILNHYSEKFNNNPSQKDSVIYRAVQTASNTMLLNNNSTASTLDAISQLVDLEARADYRKLTRFEIRENKFDTKMHEIHLEIRKYSNKSDAMHRIEQASNDRLQIDGKNEKDITRKNKSEDDTSLIEDEPKNKNSPKR